MIEWWLVLTAIFGLLIALMLVRIPVAIAFLAANVIIFSFLIGLDRGLITLVNSMYDAVSRFALTPVPLFILMGELLLRSGVALKSLDALNQLLGRLPGRLSVLAVLGGTLFAVLSGSSLANTSMLGSVLVPEMHRRGYSTKMSIGSVTAGGGMASLIPPSALMVLLGGVGGISIGGLLLGSIIPGFLLAVIFIGYIVIACRRNPDLAPSYDMKEVPRLERYRMLVVYVLPLGGVFFAVTGLIFLGVATPTEAAAVGVLACLVLVVGYRQLTLKVVHAALVGTARLNGMLLLIIAAAAGYSQLLAFSGVSRGLVSATAQLAVPALAIVALLLLITIAMGTFMDAIAMMMITIPLFVPIVVDLGFSPIWFGIMFLVCLDIGGLTPPVGLLLFVMKGVVPPDITMGQIVASVWPFVVRELGLVGLILFFPQLVLWLPSLAF